MLEKALGEPYGVEPEPYLPEPWIDTLSKDAVDPPAVLCPGDKVLNQLQRLFAEVEGSESECFS